MSIDTNRLVTADGYPYRVLASDLGYPQPYAIFVNGVIARLDDSLVCAENNGYSLTEKRNSNTRYFNVYRAADGAFTLGSRAFNNDYDRCATRDSQRALFGLSVTFDEFSGNVTTAKV